MKKSGLAAIVLSFSASLHAMDPQPRQWNHLPLDRNFGIASLIRTSAKIFFDPTLRIEGAELELDTFAFNYVRTFEFLERSSRIQFTQAHQSGVWEGLLNGQPGLTRREGFSDLFIRGSINLYGAPPLRGKDFTAYRNSLQNETLVGAAIVARLPTGHYRQGRLLNLGENRYVVKPQLGVTHTRGPWTLELTGELWLHEDNDEFFGKNRLEQEPLYFAHGHVVRSLPRGRWASFSLGYNYGGETRINGRSQGDLKKNYGWKLTYAQPISDRAGIRLSYLGARTRQDTGSDLTTFAAGLTFSW